MSDYEYRPAVPKVFGEFVAALADLRVTGRGRVRFRLDGVLPEPEDLLRLAEAQSEESVHVVLLSESVQAIPIPGTEPEGDRDMAVRVARGLRLLAALEAATIAARRNGQIPWDPPEDGRPAPFAPGTEVGETDAETRERVGELADQDPDGAAAAAARAVRPGPAPRRRRRADPPEDDPEAAAE